MGFENIFLSFTYTPTGSERLMPQPTDTGRKFLGSFSLNVILLGIISFLTDASTEMIIPILPLFLLYELGAPGIAIGLIEGAAESTASIVKLISGMRSDKIKKRKPFIFAGYGISTLSKCFFALSSVWQHVVGLRILERIGKGIRTAPRDALIAESANHEELGKVYGFHRAMDTAGAVLGAVLALMFVYVLPLNFRTIFLLAVFPAALAVLVILFLREAPRAEDSSRDQTQDTKVSLRALSGELRAFILAASLLSIGTVSIAFLLLNVSVETSGDYVMPVMFYVWFNVVYMLLSLPAGSLSDKIGRFPTILVGCAALMVMFLISALASSVFVFVIAFLLFGVFFAFTEAAKRAYVVEIAPPHLKGTALGTLHATLGFVALPLGIITGYILDWSGNFSSAFLFCMTITALAFVILIYLASQKSSSPHTRS
jgi:MFS family permease